MIEKKKCCFPKSLLLQEVSFLWGKDGINFEGQNSVGNLVDEISLKVINESLGKFV